MVFSPRSATLGVLVLVPIATMLGYGFMHELGALLGFLGALALSIVGSFHSSKS